MTICIYIYISKMYICIHIYICIHTCMYTYTYIFLYIYIYIYLFTYTYVSKHNIYSMNVHMYKNYKFSECEYCALPQNAAPLHNKRVIYISLIE